jgi:phosphoglycerate-specific signal transduction histidine kinase
MVEERTIELKQTHKQLVDTARMAGRAEITTGILHNVGNVLNSVSVSAEYILENVKSIRTDSLSKILHFINDSDNEIGSYLESVESGAKFKNYIETLSKNYDDAKTTLIGLINSLYDHILHMREIISIQQKYAVNVEFKESCFIDV